MVNNAKLWYNYPVAKFKTGKRITMAEKTMIDLKEFIDSVNKKNKDHNGKKIRFAFVKRKRK